MTRREHTTTAPVNGVDQCPCGTSWWAKRIVGRKLHITCVACGNRYDPDRDPNPPDPMTQTQDNGDYVTEAVIRERLTMLGEFIYICTAEGGPRHAVSRELHQDCMWHGEECDCWSVLVDPFDVAMLLADAAANNSRTLDHPEAERRGLALP